MDPMTVFDQTQDSELQAEMNRHKADAIRAIEEMPPTAFLAFWERHGSEMDALATGDKLYGSEALRLRSAMATKGQKHPVCEEIPF